MKNISLLNGLLLAAGIILALPAQAALHDRGGGLIYDDVLNITWLQDANYAKTSGYDADGLMTWAVAKAWADGLTYYDSVRSVNYDDWRLPTAKPINGTAFNFTYSAQGNRDIGYNISAPGTIYAGSTANEMAYLYYQDLHNPGRYNTTGTLSGCYISASNTCLDNTGPFVNLMAFAYWTDKEYTPNTTRALYFGTLDGSQDSYGKTSGNGLYALAVRDGDVSVSPVPEAEAYALMLVGLGLVGWIARRRG